MSPCSHSSSSKMPFPFFSVSHSPWLILAKALCHPPLESLGWAESSDRGMQFSLENFSGAYSQARTYFHILLRTSEILITIKVIPKQLNPYNAFFSPGRFLDIPKWCYSSCPPSYTFCHAHASLKCIGLLGLFTTHKYDPYCFVTYFFMPLSPVKIVNSF